MLFNYQYTVARDEMMELLDWLNLDTVEFICMHGDKDVYSAKKVRHFINTPRNAARLTDKVNDYE